MIKNSKEFAVLYSKSVAELNEKWDDFNLRLSALGITGDDYIFSVCKFIRSIFNWADISTMAEDVLADNVNLETAVSLGVKALWDKSMVAEENYIRRSNPLVLLQSYESALVTNLRINYYVDTRMLIARAVYDVENPCALSYCKYEEVYEHLVDYATTMQKLGETYNSFYFKSDELRRRVIEIESEAKYCTLDRKEYIGKRRL